MKVKYLTRPIQPTQKAARLISDVSCYTNFEENL